MKRLLLSLCAGLMAASAFPAETLAKAEKVSLMRFSDLIGTSVQTKDGAGLGQVQDVVLDPQTGAIRFALLAKGDFVGAGKRLVPIPWKAVNVQAEKQYVVNVDREKLSSIPMFEPDETTQLDQPEYILRVYRFYQLEPIEGAGAPGADVEIQQPQQNGDKDVK